MKQLTINRYMVALMVVIMALISAVVLVGGQATGAYADESGTGITYEYTLKVTPQNPWLNSDGNNAPSAGTTGTVTFTSSGSSTPTTMKLSGTHSAKFHVASGYIDYYGQGVILGGNTTLVCTMTQEQYDWYASATITSASFSYGGQSVSYGAVTLSDDYDNDYVTLSGYNTPSRWTTNLSIMPILPDPTKEGYTFTGWYLDVDCTIPYDNTPITENTDLYAGWQINQYSVTFVTNGGTSIAAQTVDYNTMIAPVTTTRTDYNFFGWYTDANLTTPFDPTVTAIKADTTLYAAWDYKYVVITYVTNGGDEIAPTQHTKGQVLAEITPIRTGYNFGGWHADMDCSIPYNFGDAVSADTTLYAAWERIVCRIRLFVDAELYAEFDVYHGTTINDIITLIAGNGLELTELYDNQYMFSALGDTDQITGNMTIYGTTDKDWGFFSATGNFIDANLRWFAGGIVALFAIVGIVVGRRNAAGGKREGAR